MMRLRPAPRLVAIAAALHVAALGIGAGTAARGDTITLKNGTIYRGTIDRDKPVIWIYDGLKRIVISAFTSRPSLVRTSKTCETCWRRMS